MHIRAMAIEGAMQKKNTKNTKKQQQKTPQKNPKQQKTSNQN